MVLTLPGRPFTRRVPLTFFPLTFDRDSMYGAWEVDQSTTYFSFSNYLVNYFHGPAGTDCDIVGAGSCDGQVNCGTHNAPNANINSPAGYM